MPVVPLDTWAIILGLVGAVGILWRYSIAQNDKANAARDEAHKRELADKAAQITQLQTERDALITKNEQMQEMIWTQTRTADVAAQAMEGTQPPRKVRR